jgi:hypothetical protein
MVIPLSSGERSVVQISSPFETAASGWFPGGKPQNASALGCGQPVDHESRLATLLADLLLLNDLKNLSESAGMHGINRLWLSEFRQ